LRNRMAEISSQLNQKYEELRGIGQELATLVGREPKFPRKRAITMDEEAPATRSVNDRRISYDAKDRGEVKRSRLIEDEPPRRIDRDRRDNQLPPLRRPTMQSSVRMPTIETKSREEIIAEQRKSQTGADGARNRRMFGNLLMGTLKQFQQEEKEPAFKAQHDKLKEVEEKLEKSVRQDKEKYLQEKKAVEIKLREKEMEIKRLKQKQAIKAKNENKIAHYKRLQNFIQTETKPPIFFLPARLTLRGMELLKQSSRNLDTLIKERETEMETELRDLEELSDGEIGPAIRSSVKVVVKDNDSRAHLKPMNGDGGGVIDDGLDDDDMDDDDDVFPTLRSSVVVKKPDSSNDEKDEKNNKETKKESEKESNGDNKRDKKDGSKERPEGEEIKRKGSRTEETEAEEKKVSNVKKDESASPSD
jgi:hypothetical protein